MTGKSTRFDLPHSMANSRLAGALGDSYNGLNPAEEMNGSRVRDQSARVGPDSRCPSQIA